MPRPWMPPVVHVDDLARQPDDTVRLQAQLLDAKKRPRHVRPIQLQRRALNLQTNDVTDRPLHPHLVVPVEALLLPALETRCSVLVEMAGVEPASNEINQ